MSFAPTGNNIPSSGTPGLSGVAAALLPVMVGYEVMIDGTAITPVAAITQHYGSHHTLQLSFGHEVVQPEGTFTIEEAQSLLGKPATVVLKNRNNPDAPRLECRFVIADIALAQEDLDEGMLTLTGYSPTWLLDGAPHYESFTGKTLKEIATAVAAPLAQTGASLRADPYFSDTLPFICRYNESAWNFLKRLAGETGQWLYFNGSALVFGKPRAERAVKLIYGQDCYKLQLSMRAAPVQAGIFDYNAAQDSPIAGKAHTPFADAGSYAGAAFKQSKSLFSAPAYAAPAALGGEKGVVEAMGRARAEGVAASLYVLKGESTLFTLRAGSLIDVEFRRRGEGASHGQMRIVSVSHQLEGSGHYSNTFEAIPAGAGAPPLCWDTPATHAVLARVTDNADPYGQGRVKAEFMGWEEGGGRETGWLRVATPDGGGTDAVSSNRGFVFVPEVGDQVFVSFLEGNPDKPYISGSAFHGGNARGQSNMVRTIMTKSGNKIILNDHEGSITVSDPSGNVWYMDGKGNINVTAPGNISLSAGENINISAGMNITGSAGMNTLLSSGANMATTVGQIMKTNVGGNHKLEVQGNSMEYIKGDYKSDTQTRTEIAKKGYNITSTGDKVIVKASEEIQKHSGEKSKTA